MHQLYLNIAGKNREISPERISLSSPSLPECGRALLCCWGHGQGPSESRLAVLWLDTNWGKPQALSCRWSGRLTVGNDGASGKALLTSLLPLIPCLGFVTYSYMTLSNFLNLPDLRFHIHQVRTNAISTMTPLNILSFSFFHDFFCGFVFVL